VGKKKVAKDKTLVELERILKEYTDKETRLMREYDLLEKQIEDSVTRKENVDNELTTLSDVIEAISNAVCHITGVCTGDCC